MVNKDDMVNACFSSTCIHLFSFSSCSHRLVPISMKIKVMAAEAHSCLFRIFT